LPRKPDSGAFAGGFVSDYTWNVARLKINSVARQYQRPALLVPLLSLLTKVSAMGLLRGQPIHELNPATLRAVLDAVQEDGLLAAQRAHLQPLLEVNAREPGQATLLALASTLAALDESPVPKREWVAMRDVFGDDDLAKLVGVSASSLKRYASHERSTPDDIADRLHYLAMVVAELSGSYNDLGIRRWFERSRAQLDGRSPREALGPDWEPGQTGPRSVRGLAQSLFAGGAT
jgi:hypothetical protein